MPSWVLPPQPLLYVPPTQGDTARAICCSCSISTDHDPRPSAHWQWGRTNTVSRATLVVVPSQGEFAAGLVAAFAQSAKRVPVGGRVRVRLCRCWSETRILDSVCFIWDSLCFIWDSLCSCWPVD